MITRVVRSALAVMTCCVLIAGSAFAANDRAVLRFADLGGIRDWRAETDKAMLIEGRDGQWYKATFFAPCVGLRFANTVAFVTEPTGDLSKFSSIIAQGERCWFRSFEPAAAPGKAAISVAEAETESDGSAN